MVNIIKTLYSKYSHYILYLAFGVVTTLANFLVYYPLFNLCGLSAAASNMIAWIFAVIVAFLTNKPIVFKSTDWSAKTVLPEFGKFVASRIGSGVLETLILFITVDMCMLDGNSAKIIVSILVIILNYITSRFLVFRKR